MENVLVLQREHILLAILVVATLVLGLVPPLEVAGMMMWFYLAPALIAAYVTSVGIFLAVGAVLVLAVPPLMGVTDLVFYPAMIVSYLLVASVAAVRRLFGLDETLLVATGVLIFAAYPLLAVIYYYLSDLELMHATLMTSRYVVQSMLCILMAEAVVLAATLTDSRWLASVRSGLGFRPSLVQVAELITSVAVTISLVTSLIMFWRTWEADINEEVRSAAYDQLEDRNSLVVGVVTERMRIALQQSLDYRPEGFDGTGNVARFARDLLNPGVGNEMLPEVAVALGDGVSATEGWSADALARDVAQASGGTTDAAPLAAFMSNEQPVLVYRDNAVGTLLVRFRSIEAAERFEHSPMIAAHEAGDEVILVDAPRDATTPEAQYAIPEFGEIVESVEGGVIWRDDPTQESANGLYMMSNMAPGLTASFKLSDELAETYERQLHSAAQVRAQVNVWTYFLDFARAVTLSTLIDVIILALLLMGARVLISRLIEPLGGLTRIFESWRQFRGGELGSGAALQAMDSSGLSALKDIHSLQQGFRALAQDVMYGERRLSTIAANYDELLRSLPLGVLAVDGASRVQFLNDALGEMTGQRQDALQRLKGQAAQMLASGTTVDEWQLVLDDASPKSLLLVVNHRLDERGQESGLWVIVTDLTEQKQTSAQLIQASKLATLGEMSTGMAHELNQPLNVISLATSNLRFTIKKGKATPDNTLSKLDRIDGAVHRAANIIDHMRAFGRLAGEGLTEINLGEVVGGACNLLGEQLKLANIALLNEVPDEGLMVKGNAIQLEQVLINLVNNAKDAIKETQSAGTITVDSEIGGGRVRIRVTDSGGGIPDHVLPHIFEPFFTTKPVGKGTGLGGSISYGIIREMQGDIWAENVSGGAQITISLPLVEFEAIDTATFENA